MSFVKFFPFNLVRESTTEILPDDTDAFFPASNLKSHLLTKVYRTPSGITDLGITFDFKTTEDIDAVLIKSSMEGHGFTGDLVIKANPTNANWGSPAFQTTLTPSQEFGVGFATFTEESYRFWRIEASRPGEDYVEISKIFIGKHVGLTTNNINFGWRFKLNDQSKFRRNRYGDRYIDKISVKKAAISAGFTLLNVEETKVLLDMFNTNGETEPIWFITDIEAAFSDDPHRYFIMGFLAGIPEPVNSDPGLYSLSFRIEE